MEEKSQKLFREINFTISGITQAKCKYEPGSGGGGFLQRERKRERKEQNERETYSAKERESDLHIKQNTLYIRRKMQNSTRIYYANYLCSPFFLEYVSCLSNNDNLEKRKKKQKNETSLLFNHKNCVRVMYISPAMLYTMYD